MSKKIKPLLFSALFILSPIAHQPTIQKNISGSSICNQLQHKKTRRNDKKNAFILTTSFMDNNIDPKYWL